MVLQLLQGFLNAFTDRDTGHDDHELLKAVGFVERENTANVNVGLPGAGLHLNGEVAIGEGLIDEDVIFELALIYIFKQASAERDLRIARFQHVAGAIGIEPHVALGYAIENGEVVAVEPTEQPEAPEGTGEAGTDIVKKALSDIELVAYMLELCEANSHDPKLIATMFKNAAK